MENNNKRTISRKITYLLMFLVLCSVVPLLVVAYTNLFFNTIAIQREMLLAKVASVADITNSEISRVNRHLDAIADSLWQRDKADDSADFLQARLQEEAALFEQVVLLSQDGAAALVNGNAGAAPTINGTVQALIRRLRETREHVLHTVTAADGGYRLHSIRRARANGERGELIYTTKGLNELQSHLNQVTLRGNGFFLIVDDRNYQTLLQLHREQPEQVDERFIEAARAQTLQYHQPADLAQTHVGSCDCHAAVAAVPAAGWVVVSALPMHEFVYFMKQMDKAVFFALCFIVFATYYCTYFARKTLVKPVTAIADTANAIHDSGNLQQRVQWWSEDEMGGLADTINRMLAKLERSTGELEAQRRYRHKIIDSIGDALFIVNDEGMIREANPAATAMLGYWHDELTHMCIDQLCKTHDVLALAPSVDGAAQDEHKSIEREFLHKEGHDVPVAISVARVTAGDDQSSENVLIVKDISERKKAEQHLHYLANHDTLTGLPNQMLLLERVNQAIARVPWVNKHVAILFMDLDKFKEVNDTLGHSAGDELLIEVAQRLQGSVRDGDTVARQGGDEFVILLDDLAETADINTVLERLLGHLRSPVQVQGMQILPTASLGIAVYPDDATELNDLFRKADTAMYHAKREGRDGYAFYTPTMDAVLQSDEQLQSQLVDAIGKGELEIHYQPQFATDDNRVVAVEALLRWRRADSVIMPDTLLPLAADAGYMVKLGEWVIRRACEQMAVWRQWGLDDLTLVINISDAELYYPTFVTLVESVLRETQLPPQCLELDVSEAVIGEDFGLAAAHIASLQRLGVAVAVDDFGSGVSSVRQLQQLGIRKLKIDRDIVEGVAVDPAKRQVMQTMINLAKGLGAPVFAEGVETVEQRQVVGELGCDGFQGFVACPPVPPRSVALFISGRRIRRGMPGAKGAGGPHQPALA